MKRILVILIGINILFYCSEKNAPSVQPIEQKEQQIVVDKELGEGKQFKEFLNSIRTKNCNGIVSNLDDTVYLSLGEGIDAEFRRKDKFREQKWGYSICDLFFDRGVLPSKFGRPAPVYSEDPYFLNSAHWLEKSIEIRFIAMKATSSGDEVNAAFFGGRHYYPDQPGRTSRDVDFLFRCPNGFQEKCYLYSYSFN
jgi:hypothetical protein